MSKESLKAEVEALLKCAEEQYNLIELLCKCDLKAASPFVQFFDKVSKEMQEIRDACPVHGYISDD